MKWAEGLSLESFRHALAQLRQHKLRTSLTLLGMVFGVGAVIAMLSIGEGAQQEAMRLIESMGLRNLLVQNRDLDYDTLLEVREKSVGLSRSDVRAMQQTLPSVEDVSEEKRIKTWALFSFEAPSEAQVLAATPSYFDLASLDIASGRAFDEEDNRLFRPVAVLGAQAARDLFPSGEPLGKRIKVNHLWLEVIGVLADRDLSKDEFQGVRLGGDRNRVFLPLETAYKRLKFEPLESELDSIRLRLAEGASPQRTAQTVNHLLARRHSGQNDYELVVPAALLKQQQQTQQIFTIVMSAIAGISLLVGGIGIMNIMLATVLERTREIGLLRAIGARKVDIQQQFLMESATVAAIGAVIGIFFGLVLAFAIQQFAGWPAAWSPFAIVLSVTICLVTGIVFGWYPAKQAADLDPIKALHAE
ncbi:FtsX-like permease family protein [Marinihelvus fidelis]|uniref:FtsX-like permease family protein n=1 Tax=Marinihelvus fidelis TaxID=2613842 RepID=A0A5N0TCE1_9GAMM|nr:ABC transporter permease [Marinihelvus fidelis]KAA9131506.1 FtsX-like permease family protein [Marinihelvus fidelis]